MAKKPPSEGWRDKECYKYRKTFRGKDSQGRGELQFKRQRLGNVSIVWPLGIADSYYLYGVFTPSSVP